MTWKYEITVPAGVMVPVPASNLLRERRGKCLLEAQPSDRLPGVTPGERAAPRLASQAPVPYWSVTQLVPQRGEQLSAAGAAGSWGEQLSARCLVLSQGGAALLSRAGRGGTQATSGVRWALKLGEGGQGTLYSQIPAFTP